MGKHFIAVLATIVFVAGCSTQQDREDLAVEWRKCVDGIVIAGWTLNQVAPSSDFGKTTGLAIRQCGTGGLSAAERFKYVATSLKSIQENADGFVREFEAREDKSKIN